MGSIGGFLWHFGKGWRNSPKYEKIAGALYSARMRAPILGGKCDKRSCVMCVCMSLESSSPFGSVVCRVSNVF